MQYLIKKGMLKDKRDRNYVTRSWIADCITKFAPFDMVALTKQTILVFVLNQYLYFAAVYPCGWPYQIPTRPPSRTQQTDVESHNC